MSFATRNAERTTRILDCAGRPLHLERAAIMGILNVTPDSFSDGGVFLSRESALAHARRMVEEGADIIDVGGESTRPGAQSVSEQEELDRVVPVIEALHARLPVPISIDTSKPAVMRAAVAAGAGFINDVRALREDGALAAAAQLNVPVCLMHMQGEPRSMQAEPRYSDVIAEIRDFLSARIAACRAADIEAGRLVIDPGFGFGKTFGHNARILRELGAFAGLGLPLLVGLSRKSMIAHALDLPVGERLPASLALAVLAVRNGARIVRTHDVRATREAVRMVESIYTD